MAQGLALLAGPDSVRPRFGLPGKLCRTVRPASPDTGSLLHPVLMLLAASQETSLFFSAVSAPRSPACQTWAHVCSVTACLQNFRPVPDRSRPWHLPGKLCAIPPKTQNFFFRNQGFCLAESPVHPVFTKAHCHLSMSVKMI